MSVNARNVFLVSGQRQHAGENGLNKLSPLIEQCVVIADSGVAAYQVLAAQ